MNKKDKIIDAANKLAESAIFNMSLASKELFHSNFWAWLMSSEKYGYEMARIFFKGLKRKDYDCKKIEREKGNMDISFTNKAGDKLYVIENKLKSYPSQKQLETYENQNKKIFNKGIITGVIKPEFIDDLNNWDFVKYEDISSKICKEILPLIKGKDKNIIKEYCEMLNNIDLLINNFYDGLVKDGLPIFEKDNKYIEKIKHIRMYDLCQKYAAYCFLENFKKSSEYQRLKKNTPMDCELRTGTSYSNGKFIIDIVLRKNVGKTSQENIGIQIEGSQYRRVAQEIFEHDNKDKNKEAVYKKYLKNKWFFDYKKENKGQFKKGNSKIFTETSMNQPCDSYRGSRDYDDGHGYYAHVYQYWNIKFVDNHSNILFKEIYTDIKEAIKIFS